MMTIHSTNNDDDGNSSHDLNGDNEDVTISADDGRASSCNMSVSRLMRRRDDTKIFTDPPARVTNNRRDQAIRSPYYGDLISPHLCCCKLRPTASDLAHELQIPRASEYHACIHCLLSIVHERLSFLLLSLIFCMGTTAAAVVSCRVHGHDLSLIHISEPTRPY